MNRWRTIEAAVSLSTAGVLNAFEIETTTSVSQSLRG
jgi:hypothetical protein